MNRLPMIVGLTLLAAWAAPEALAQAGGANKGQANKEAKAQVERTNEMRQRADSAREDAEERVERERERAEEMRQEAEEQGNRDGLRGQENAATRGNEKSQEMRARSDERKEIKNQYRENLEPGQEGADLELDAEDRGDDQQKKAKKPWWKFWGD